MDNSEYNGVDIYPSDNTDNPALQSLLLTLLICFVVGAMYFVNESEMKSTTPTNALGIKPITIAAPPVKYKTVPSAVCYLPAAAIHTVEVFTVGKNSVTKIELRAYPDRMIITRAVNEDTIKRRVPTKVEYPAASIPCFYSEKTVVDTGNR